MGMNPYCESKPQTSDILVFQTVLIKQSGNSDVFNAADENTYPIRTELMPKMRGTLS
jgi:hypothetical protein